MFYVFSFPPTVYVGTLNLIASIPGPSILTFHTYQMAMSIFILRDIGYDFKILFHVFMKFLKARKIVPDWKSRSAASHLGLYCLAVSHKHDK